MIPVDFESMGAESFMMVHEGECFRTEKPVCFLFNIVQIEDIVSDIVIAKIPFSAPYLDGLSTWRNIVLPVLSLGELFGLAPQNTGVVNRAMVVKTGGRNALHTQRGVIRMGSGSRLVNHLPRTEPVQAPSFFPDAVLPAARGIYRAEDGGMIIVPDMDKILSGEFNDVFI